AGGSVPVEFDNTKNGLSDFILAKLQSFVKNDFQEFNSRPYQGFSVIALENLYDFADEGRVQRGAQIVLDYLSAKFATSSNGLRRLAPFRRRRVSLANRDFFRSVPGTDIMRDKELDRFLVTTGYTVVPCPGETTCSVEANENMLFAATTS